MRKASFPTLLQAKQRKSLNLPQKSARPFYAVNDAELRYSERALLLMVLVLCEVLLRQRTNHRLLLLDPLLPIQTVIS